MERSSVVQLIGGSAFFLFADGMVKVDETIYLRCNDDATMTVVMKDGRLQIFTVVEAPQVKAACEDDEAAHVRCVLGE